MINFRFKFRVIRISKKEDQSHIVVGLYKDTYIAEIWKLWSWEFAMTVRGMMSRENNFMLKDIRTMRISFE